MITMDFPLYSFRWFLFQPNFVSLVSLHTCADEYSAEDSRGTLCGSQEFFCWTGLSSLIVWPSNSSHIGLPGFPTLFPLLGKPLVLPGFHPLPHHIAAWKLSRKKAWGNHRLILLVLPFSCILLGYPASLCYPASLNQILMLLYHIWQ